MQRKELEKWLRKNGSVPVRNNSHEFWRNEVTGGTSTVPNHPDIKENTARKICDQLKIPRHPALR